MFIKINDSNLFFDIYGSKLMLNKDSVVQKPTLIVLHGGHGFADHTLYVEFWSQFQDVAQVVFIDQHGCGRSDAGTPNSWNLSRWATDIKLFCDALGIEKPILAGVSMGGHVIGEYCRHYSDSLGGVILCNTEANFSAKGIADQFIKHGHPDAANACIQFYMDPSEQTFKDYMQYCLPLYAKNAYSDAEKKRCIGNNEVFLHYVKNQVNNFDYREDFSKINCPVLIMAGEKGSHTPEAALEMASYIPKQLLTCEVFKDAGAPVYKDEPNQAKKVVSKYLSGLCEPY